MEAEILQRLYDSAINFKIEADWHDGVTITLISDQGLVNAFFEKVSDGIIELAKAAAQHFPHSEFATWWRSQNGK